MKKKKQLLNQLTTSYLRELNTALAGLDLEKMNKAFEALMKVYKDNKCVYFLGNGGAAATAIHMANDLGKGTLVRVYDGNEKRLRTISLTDNVSLLTAYANDLGYDNIFVQQLTSFLDKGDLVVAISGSGESENVIKAVRYAKKCGAKTIGLLGFNTGGRLAKLVDIPIIIQSRHYGPIEDVQLVISHILTSWFAKTKTNFLELKKNKNKHTPFDDKKYF